MKWFRQVAPGKSCPKCPHRVARTILRVRAVRGDQLAALKYCTALLSQDPITGLAHRPADNNPQKTP